MSDESITHEELDKVLAKAIAALAERAGEATSSVSERGAARDYAEAAERLANALAITASLPIRADP